MLFRNFSNKFIISISTSLKNNLGFAFLLRILGEKTISREWLQLDRISLLNLYDSLSSLLNLFRQTAFPAFFDIPKATLISLESSSPKQKIAFNFRLFE